MGKHKTNAMKNKAREGMEWASLDTASYCPRKRQSEALIFSKGSTVPTQHMRVGPGQEINPSPLIRLVPQHLGQALVCSLHRVIHRPTQGPLPFAGQALPMLPFLIPASQLSGQEARTSHFSPCLLLPEALQPFVRPCPGMS